MADLITVHDPRGYPPKVTGKRLAPRLSGLDGKIVYLVDCLFDNSAAFMEQLRQWFGAHLHAANTHVFARVAKSTARLRGIPTLRQAFVPQPVVGRTPPELRTYIEGSDQISGRPFMQEVIDGLTPPLDDA